MDADTWQVFLFADKTARFIMIEFFRIVVNLFMGVLLQPLVELRLLNDVFERLISSNKGSEERVNAVL
ncbi:unnamed protein product [Clonostachys rosea]|uniref:Uncharacterized protein n=1 Tax=Bionectria ochroleuca TaxID=29856 RepID=A0ABY6UNG8_BIOOC|nr:unnamed protein product [Clonostachys rosea]